MSVLRVACGGSPEYLPHHATMLRSVLTERGALDAEVLYLHGPEVGAADRARLRSMVEDLGATARLLEVDPASMTGIRDIRYVAAQMWFRVFLPRLAPDVDRVLYLDADVIAVDAVEPLWRTDLAGRPVAAVQNVFEPWNAEHPSRLGLAGERSYFNSGVMLLDLAAMRAEDATAALVARALEHHDPWGDQDALNVVFAERWLPLHPRWNVMNSVLHFDHAGAKLGRAAAAEARRRPALRHFEGPGVNKPWHYLADPDAQALYLAHRRETPWPLFKPDERTLRNRLRRLRGR